MIMMATTFVAETKPQPIKIMTKKHFEFIASLIKASNDGVPAFGLQEIACGYFMNDNPRFDADRFRDACGNPLPAPPDEIIV